MDFTGTGNSPQPGAPERAAADHGQPPLLGAGDARRRLPLRPGVGARARVLRGQPAVGVLRRHPPGPGAVPGEADRRALGRRPRRLPGGQLPRALDGVERPLPRRDARLLARAERRRGRVRLPPHRVERPVPERRPAAVRVDQLHHRARRLHAARPRLVQRQAQRGELRGQPRRHRRQPELELRRRGPDGRPRDRRAARCASSATSSPRCCSRRACRCCSAATRWAARRAATTTPTARTTRSPGSTGSSTSDARGLLEFTRRLIDLRRQHPVFHRRDFFGGQRRRTAAASPTSAGSGPTAGR